VQYTSCTFTSKVGIQFIGEKYMSMLETGKHLIEGVRSDERSGDEESVKETVSDRVVYDGGRGSGRLVEHCVGKSAGLVELFQHVFLFLVQVDHPSE